MTKEARKEIRERGTTKKRKKESREEAMKDTRMGEKK